MIPVLAIPHVNRPDMLTRCLASLDVEVGKLVVVNNSKLALPALAREVITITHPNAGIAASWNECIKIFPAPYWVLVNDDIQFVPGALTEFERVCEELKENAAAVVANHGASMFAVTKRGLIKCGLFDENFYPAYMEDIDWFYRVRMAKEKIVQAVNVKVIHGVNGVGSQTIHAGRIYQKENERTFANNCSYYAQKWGGGHRHETFSHPFNDPAWPIDQWRFEPMMREVNQWHV